MRPFLYCLGILLLTPLPMLSQTHGVIDTYFTIVLSPTSEPAGVVANITTTATYPCEGYRIQTRVTQEYDTMTVHIGGLIRPAPCFATSSTATGSAYLGNIEGGTYFLKISYRGKSDLYKFISSANSFRVVPLHVDFTELQGFID